MVDEKIFGPLTFKQFVIVGAAGWLSFLALEHLETRTAVFAIVVLVAICIAYIANAPKVVIDENYLKAQQVNSKSPEVFQRMLRMRRAFVESQIYMRAEKGMSPDPKLEEALGLFNKFIEKDTPQE